MTLGKTHLVFSLILATAGSLSASQITLGQNAILNGDAESGVGSPDGGIVAVPNWTPTGQFTAVQYGAGGGFPLVTDPGPTNRGLNFFAGGPSAALSTGTQVLDVSNIAGQISSGVSFTLSGYLGGYDGQSDDAALMATFMNGSSLLGSASIGPVTEADRGGATGLLFRTALGVIPVGTTSIDFVLTLTRFDGSYDDGYADNLSFIATGGGASPVSPTPEPASIGLLVCGLGFSAAALRRRQLLKT